jgi:nucleoside-diphosphate-sugar epimerase
MKNVIVTGATSFIGTNLIKRLVEKEYNVFAVIRPGTVKINRLPLEKLHIVEADMSNYRYLDEMIGENCDSYFSLAWDGIRGLDRESLELQELNYKYSLDGLEAALKIGCKCVISAGSQAEYGLHNSEISELTSCNPINEYGKQKLRFYLDAFEICKNNSISFKEPRFFSLYGVGDNKETMLTSIVKKMLENEPCKLTECIQMWDFLHINDAVEGLIKLIEVHCSDGIYNFGSGNPRALKSFIEEIYQITQSRSKLLFGQIPYPKTGMVSIQPDISKLKKETAWEPSISFQTGVEEIIQYFKAGA